MPNLHDSNSNVGLNNHQSKENINKANFAFRVDRVYVKEISCKIPHAPGLFDSVEFKEAMGQIVPSIEISTKVQPMAAHKYEVVLHCIIQGKAKNLSLFTLEVQQAGIFIIEVPASQIEQVIKNNCVSFLHTHLSQVVTNSIVQAGFPPIILQPLQPIINQEQLSANQNKPVAVGLEKQAQRILGNETPKPS